MKRKVLVIDGSQGEGGGQILRSSLSLAMCLGQPVKIKNIRAGRKKSGLLRQHLTCVRAAKEVCDAEVSGDELCSDYIEFTPGKIKHGDYRFAVGTAGSTSLVFQTILPALLLGKGMSNIELEGGTHNQQAPSFEFLTACFLKTLEILGVKANTELQRYGFYPNGGGQWTAQVHPRISGQRLKLLERGEPVARSATTFTAKIPQHVSQRELKQVVRKLKWKEQDLREILVDSFSPGNIISLKLEFTNCVEIFEAVAQRNIRAETIAGTAINALKRYRNSSAVVGEYLADQLLLPMALFSGGSFITHEMSQHVATNIAVINQFIDSAIQTSEIESDTYKIEVQGLNLNSDGIKTEVQKSDLIV
ncbi:RNA 3'-terminal phosphate cyclase [Aliikangiella coralliicola]|uniref:RNA 3'-terminal phosphate cyclase n=1 Tax=Aliikangiella coralliicola TaxID=2592383 RepID=A0A545UIM3_9GAMM|nr:RNA 3'-terminal phosphate cyclase [Aliikangiella coralliicola]TQV89318.1 RNA 3'-terminal phosphate cyclase [Aliikangiella coralliicola]